MYHPVVGVGEGVGVRVGVAFGQGVHDHEPSPRRHDQQGDHIGAGQRSPEQHKGEKGPHKGRDGVIRAGLRRPEAPLCPDIEENAQAAGYKSKEHGSQGAAKAGQLLSQNQGDQKRAAAGKEALQYHDLVGAFIGNAAGAVVFQAPTGGGQQDEYRAVGELKAVRPLKGQDHAGQRDQGDGDPKPFADSLVENRQGNERGDHDLEIAKQRGVRGVSPGNANHQKNGRQNVQDDHSQRIRQVLLCQTL